MEARVHVKWTKTAKESLKGLPLKVRKGLLGKADELTNGPDPREWCKPLTGPLQGYYRIVYSRYRAIFSVREEKLVNGDKLLHLEVVFVAAGIRKELDKKDVYRVAQKLVESVLPELSGDINEVAPKKKDEN
jgi:mRNA-degrading endonuclease RelE of RelBE toxin-antitoxin system